MTSKAADMVDDEFHRAFRLPVTDLPDRVLKGPNHQAPDIASLIIGSPA